MITVTISKQIKGKTVKVSKTLDEETATLKEFNGEIQEALGKLFDKE